MKGAGHIDGEIMETLWSGMLRQVYEQAFTKVTSLRVIKEVIRF